MPKSILAATMMAVAFTFVSIGTVTITPNQAFAGKKKKSDKKVIKMKKVRRSFGNDIFQWCVEDGGATRVSGTGKNVRCRIKKKSITCPAGKRRGGCKVRWRR